MHSSYSAQEAARASDAENTQLQSLELLGRQPQELVAAGARLATTISSVPPCPLPAPVSQRAMSVNSLPCSAIALKNIHTLERCHKS